MSARKIEERPLVSVACITYNHERYIRKALESFVMQRTDFPFEVIVHDDASTDGTRAIIEEYVEKYPNLFVPVYQTENQHSKGLNILVTFLLPRMQGDYIAVCEGDDYWCDENKLQKQFTFMERHLNCSMCAHEAYCVFEDGTMSNRVYTQNLSSFSHFEREIYMEDMPDCLGAFPTASMFIRRNVIEKHKEMLKRTRIYDHGMQILFADAGYLYVNKDKMSAYRMQAKGSYNERITKDKEFYIAHMAERIQIYKDLDLYLEKHHSDVFCELIRQREIMLYIAKGDKGVLFYPGFIAYLKRLATRNKVATVLNLLFPRLCDIRCRWRAKKKERIRIT